MELKTSNSLNTRILIIYIIFSLTLSAAILGFYYKSFKYNPTPLFSSITTSITNNVNFVSDAYHWITEGYYHKTPAKDVVEVKIEKGDTLMSILRNNGVEKPVAQKVINSLEKLYNLKTLYIGQQITFVFDKKVYTDLEGLESSEYKLAQFNINIDYYKNISISRNYSDEYVAKEVAIPLKKYITRAHGIIDNSLMATASGLGIPNESLIDLVKAYSYDVDFQRDIKAGDEIDVVFERYYNDKGEYSHDGDIIYSSLTLSEKNLSLYKYKTSKGDFDYYTSEGNSVRKDLLKTPINVVRISSGFGMRHHPVLGYSKMHKGVDFAAPIGTPIFAAGNGVIEEIGRKGAYGNYIRIRHGNGYSTAYAHISSFAKSLRRGSYVKQGEVIAKVGTTGRSTGPHLHFEVIEAGQQINPMLVKLKPGVKLSGSELAKFNKFKAGIENTVATISNQSEIAFNDSFRY
jgi:murein DD-endopeptidase MepM/ murein hydrolase activator NlpD